MTCMFVSCEIKPVKTVSYVLTHRLQSRIYGKSSVFTGREIRARGRVRVSPTARAREAGARTRGCARDTP